MKALIISTVLAAVLSAAFCGRPALAQGGTVSADVYFRQNVTEVDLSYGGNGERLSSFADGVAHALSDPDVTVSHIVVRSSASPEGPWNHNIQLSRARCESICGYLSGVLGLPRSLFVTEAAGEDWAGLRELVLAHPVPHREAVLEAVDSCLAHGGPTARQSALCKMKLDTLCGRRPFDWMLENLFPLLRRGAGSSVVCHFVPRRAVSDTMWHVSRDTVWSFSRDTVVVLSRDTVWMAGAAGAAGTDGAGAVARRRPHRQRKGGGWSFHLFTGLPYDLLLCPSLGVELPVGRRVSLLAEGTYPVYPYAVTDGRVFQMYSAAFETRIWLGDRTRRDRLTGWFLGAYGGAFRGDVQWGGKGVQVPQAWHAGLSAGYALAFGRRRNWRLGIYAGAGYAPVDHDTYVPGTVDGSPALVRTGGGRKLWWGPTRFGLTLGGMLPGTGKEKGGAR